MADRGRSYTRDEAMALIPTVRAIVLQLAVERRRLDEELGRMRGLAGDDGAAALEAQQRIVGQIGEAVSALVGHLEQMGVQLRDPDRGLVDIPTERDGEPVWFCWELADGEIGFWHTRREGFANRRPW